MRIADMCGRSLAQATELAAVAKSATATEGTRERLNHGDPQMAAHAVEAAMAHEVTQSLAGMVANADAGLRWLDRPSADLEEAKAAFRQIIADGHRMAAVVASIRAALKNQIAHDKA
jgi:hypothetical protein